MKSIQTIGILLLAFQIKAQTVKDSITPTTNMQDLVITGQYNPQSVNKSIYDVKVISREMIDRQAGNNLADILNQSLNLNILPSANSGKSSGQMFGLDAQYFKILVDNIPLINDEGLGNNTDLTQINLDDILRIEIVEGSMGVEYGSNAIAGIINIITKKSSTYKWTITPMIQEETVGSEYNLRDQGRHIQSIKIEHNLTDRIFANVTYTRNDFKGFWHNQKGKYHTLNDSLRGYNWLPKEQNTLKGTIRYKRDNYNLFYKIEFFDEEIQRYNVSVLENFNPATQTSNPTANDAEFNSKRWVHHLNASGRFKQKFNYDMSLSFQQQKRKVSDYIYSIRDDIKTDVKNYTYESRKGFYSRGSISNFIVQKTFDFQLGYELSIIDGYASQFAGDFQEPIARSLENYDVYASSEIKLSDNFSIRPGARIMFSPQFDNQFAWSFSAKYNLPKNYELRAIYGSSPRLPNYDELYSYFVDVNHNIQGNTDLKPEQGQSVFVHLKKSIDYNGLKVLPKLSTWYMDVRDRIDLVVVNEVPLMYSYRNLNRYQSYGSTLQAMADYKNISAGLGITFSGVSQEIDDRPSQTSNFLNSIQTNFNLSYKLPKTNTMFSVFMKYNGQMYQYVQRVDDAGLTTYIKGKQNDYSWFDASIRQSFYKDKIQTTIGARNLFNVTNVRTSATEGLGHSSAVTNLNLGYGRSYFLKLLYHINI